jgi:hypothetical protein
LKSGLNKPREQVRNPLPLRGFSRIYRVEIYFDIVFDMNGW